MRQFILKNLMMMVLVVYGSIIFLDYIHTSRRLGMIESELRLLSAEVAEARLSVQNLNMRLELVVKDKELREYVASLVRVNPQIVRPEIELPN